MTPPNLDPNTWLRVTMENGAIHVQQLKDIQWGTPSGFVHITDWEVHEFEPNGEVSHGAGEVTVINSFTLPNPYE